MGKWLAAICKTLSVVTLPLGGTGETTKSRDRRFLTISVFSIRLTTRKEWISYGFTGDTAIFEGP